MQLKNIIYIDYEKVYSLSSQLFEGVVQSSTEQQESSLANADAVEVKTLTKSTQLSDTSKSSTVINPHDYHYLKFERELFKRNLISDISNDSLPFNKNFSSNRFVKIKCAIEINDYNKLKSTTSNFTELGHAIHYVHRNDKIEALDTLINDPKTTANVIKTLKSERAKLLKSIESDSGYSRKTFFSQLSTVLEYAYGDEIEISQSISDYKFTSFLIRNFLKISPELLVKLYSRKTSSEFTIVGIVTQSFKFDDNSSGSERPLSDIRAAAWNMNDALANLESTFCSPMENEFFVEPIALYTEI
ncbi:UNVERIFIED_ORG: hypothetical protein J2Y78_003805 [Buttiauxella agrestis ATCC 33320]